MTGLTPGAPSVNETSSQNAYAHTIGSTIAARKIIQGITPDPAKSGFGRNERRRLTTRATRTPMFVSIIFDHKRINGHRSQRRHTSPCVDLEHQVTHHAKVIGGKRVTRFHVQHMAGFDAPSAIHEDVVEAFQADSVELVGGGARRVTDELIARRQARLLEQNPIWGFRRRIEVTSDEHRVGLVTLAYARHDDPGRLKPCRLREIEMRVVDAEKSAALAIAEPGPRADPFGTEESALRWKGGRLF